MKMINFLKTFIFLYTLSLLADNNLLRCKNLLNENEKETKINDNKLKEKNKRLEERISKKDEAIVSKKDEKKAKKEEAKRKELVEELKSEKKKLDKKIKELEFDLERKNKTEKEKPNKGKANKIKDLDDIIVEENLSSNRNLLGKNSGKKSIDNSSQKASSGSNAVSKGPVVLSNKLKIFENNPKKKQDVLSSDKTLLNPLNNELSSENELLDSITINSNPRNQIINSANYPFTNQNSILSQPIGNNQNILLGSNQANLPIQNAQDMSRIPTFRVIENNNGFQSQKILKTESVEYKLPIINIDNNRNIDYYYPFFFKTKVIDYRQNFPMNNVCGKCLDITCDLCDIVNIGTCRKCRHGFFLHMGKCFNRCPINTVADIYKGSCNQLDHSASLSQVSYLKAFTFGSCKNNCGKESIDCSCDRTCIYQGNCCSDYHECEELQINNLNKTFECQTGNPNCELCENFINKEDPIVKGKILPFKCGKCREGLFMRYGECVPNCAPTDKIILPNKICISTQKCLVENCAQCIDGNPSVCKNCFGGFFLLNNQCVQDCPPNLRADRISMTCVEPAAYAWYWVFPSRTTCHGKCGAEINLAGGMDCSCNRDCLHRGNCCQDIDEFCPDLIIFK